MKKKEVNRISSVVFIFCIFLSFEAWGGQMLSPGECNNDFYVSLIQAEKLIFYTINTMRVRYGESLLNEHMAQEVSRLSEVNPLVHLEELDRIAGEVYEKLKRRSCNMEQCLKPDNTANLILISQGLLHFVIVSPDFLSPCEAAQKLVDYLKKNANLLLRLFDKKYNVVGLSFIPDTLGAESGNLVAYHVIVIFGDGKFSGGQFIQCGHLFEDFNKNDVYDPGEGISGIEFEKERQNTTMRITSFDNGLYCFLRREDEVVLKFSNEKPRKIKFDYFKGSWKNGIYYYDLKLK